MYIKENVINEIIINKSKFITYLYKIKDSDEVSFYIKEMDKKYKDATHICYSYIIDNYSKSHNASEPIGAAGIPMLNILKQNKLNHILAITIRYFGGIKLGYGGLIRAYSNSIKEALKKTNIINELNEKEITIIFPIEKLKLVNKITNDYNVANKIFNKDITYTIYIPNNEISKFKEILNKNKIKILK